MDRPTSGREWIESPSFEMLIEDMEVMLFWRIMESHTTDELPDITQTDLVEAIEAAKEKHETYEEIVREKAEKLGDVVGFLSIPVALDGSPIGLAGSQILRFAILGYSKLFEKEISTRKNLIESLSHNELSGNVHIDAIRWAWNIQFFKSTFMLKLLILAILYEIWPEIIPYGLNLILCISDGSGKKNCLLDSWNIALRNEELSRLKAAEEAYPFKRDYPILIG